MTKPEIVQLSLADFFAPCVYAWRRNGEWLYVGQSRVGLARLGSHTVIVKEEVEDNDELLVWRVDASELKDLELQLIKANHPRYNIYGRYFEPASRSVLPLPEPDAELQEEWFHQLLRIKGRLRCDGKPEKKPRQLPEALASSLADSDAKAFIADLD